MSDIRLAQWQKERERECKNLSSILLKLGFGLEEDQPHILGERYVMRALTTESGNKLILIGRRKRDNLRVVIKAASDPAGGRELTHERVCRAALDNLVFAYQTFATPQELLFTQQDGYTISVQEFIEQSSTFLARPLPEQFALALGGFKAQESAHATTRAHLRRAARIFGVRDAAYYLNTFDTFTRSIEKAAPSDRQRTVLLKRTRALLAEHRHTISQYTGFLTHTDFVPHNFRVRNGCLYLLDHSSLRFGNKYESWARFANFMELYNPPLVRALEQYVKDNRTPEETFSFTLMRLYRLGELLAYYAGTLQKCDGDLYKLNTVRITFWTKVLNAALENRPPSVDTLVAYQTTRDALRSTEEKYRQLGLH